MSIIPPLRLGDGVGDACDNCPMIFNPDQANADAEGIIAAWRFDEGNGITAFDSVGSIDGTLSGATYVSDGLGYVLDFDGDNDWVDFGDVDALDSPGAFSVAMRFLRRSEIDNPTFHGIRNVLFAQSSNSRNDNLEIGSSGGSIVLYMDTPGFNGTASISVGSPIQDNTWYHLVLTYDESELPNELKVYIDGALDAERPDWGGPLVNSSTSPLTIGVARPGGVDPAGDFDGQVDDVVLFDRALTPEEVRCSLTAAWTPSPTRSVMPATFVSAAMTASTPTLTACRTGATSVPASMTIWTPTVTACPTDATRVHWTTRTTRMAMASVTVTTPAPV